MPLIPGMGKKTLGANIEEIMNSYKNTGRIGNSTPKNRSKAQKQAIAISYKKQKQG